MEKKEYTKPHLMKTVNENAGEVYARFDPERKMVHQQNVERLDVKWSNVQRLNVDISNFERKLANVESSPVLYVT